MYISSLTPLRCPCVCIIHRYRNLSCCRSRSRISKFEAAPYFASEVNLPVFSDEDRCKGTSGLRRNLPLHDVPYRVRCTCTTIGNEPLFTIAQLHYRLGVQPALYLWKPQIAQGVTRKSDDSVFTLPCL